MAAYWLLYSTPALLALVLAGTAQQWRVLLWIAAGMLFSLAIGFRYEVGADWFNYLQRFHHTLRLPFDEVITGSDPGYLLLNWFMARQGWGIYGVNLVCGAIFMVGLSVFCRQMPAPWLGYAVAVPYLVVVMAMGYTRQSVALGFFFVALASIARGRLWAYITWVSLGATFHKSAVLLLPLGIFLFGQGWVLRSAAVAIAAYGLWDLLLLEHQEHLWEQYVDRQMESQGAKIRVFMNLVPSLLALAYARKWRALFPDYGIWFWLAIASLLSFVLVDQATTAVDRFSLYFTPLQVAVFARLPVLARDHIAPLTVHVGLVLGYAAVLFVWLNYASHAPYWLPYQNALFLE
jgi:hypothetical protein